MSIWETNNGGKSRVSTIAKRVKEIRASKGMRGDDLSARTKELGYEIPRSTLANIEIGRKKLSGGPRGGNPCSCTQVPPVALLFDYVSGEKVEVLPGVERSGIEAVEWFAGNWPILPAGGDRGRLPPSAPTKGEAFDHGTDKWAEEPETARLAVPCGTSRRRARQPYHGAVSFLDRVERDYEDVASGRPPRYGAVAARNAPRTPDDYREEVEIARQRVEMRLRDARLALSTVAIDYLACNG